MRLTGMPRCAGFEVNHRGGKLAAYLVSVRRP